MKYIKNKELLDELIISKEQGEMTDKLAEMFLMIVENYSNHRRFRYYTFLDDMKGEALLIITRYWKNFDTSHPKANPFAYFTRLTYNIFINTIKNQNRESLKKDIIYHHIGLFGLSLNWDKAIDYSVFREI